MNLRAISKYRTGISLCLLMAASPCFAQTRLSLEEAVAKALESRASLKADAERVAATRGLKQQAGLFPNPEFQFSNENLRPGQTYTQDVDTLAYVTQPLDILGKRKQRIAVAEGGVNRSQAEYELARLQVVQRVKLAYWAARGAQETRDLLKASVKNFQEIVDYHSSRLSVGMISEQDFLRVRLESERLQISANLAAIEATRARVQLLKEMGQTDGHAHRRNGFRSQSGPGHQDFRRRLPNAERPRPASVALHFRSARGCGPANGTHDRGCGTFYSDQPSGACAVRFER